MIVLGLTGSIGMGKSTAALMLRRLGVRLFDADAVVHKLLASGGAAVAAVEVLFPGVRDETGGIDRRRVGQRVFGDPAALRRLEAILHPMVRRAEGHFVRQARARRESLVVLDIPLLYETGAPERCDYVLVVSAPARVQRERVMRRPGMTESRFASILRAQMPDREKRRRADFVVPTGLGLGLTFRRLRRVVAALRHGNATRGNAARRKTSGRQCGKS
jgi:dephospho-CoA kinase